MPNQKTRQRAAAAAAAVAAAATAPAASINAIPSAIISHTTTAGSVQVMPSDPVCTACGATFRASNYMGRNPRCAACRGPYSRQGMVLAFSASGSSTRQREASWAGLLPPEMHTLILKQLPLTPEYASITGMVGTIGKGIGDGPGQFKRGSSMRQVSFGSDSTVWAVDSGGHRVHHFKPER